MRKGLLALLLGITVLFTACPGETPPTDTGGTWNQSSWDTATWR